MTTNKFQLRMLFLVLFCLFGLPAQAATEYNKVTVTGGLMDSLRKAAQNPWTFTELRHCKTGEPVKKEESLGFHEGDVLCLPNDARVDSKKVTEWFTWQGQELTARGKGKPATTHVVAKASPPSPPPAPIPAPKAPTPVKVAKVTPPPPAKAHEPIKPVQVAKVVPPPPAPVAPKATPVPEPQKPLQAVNVGSFPTVAKQEAKKLPQLPTVKSAKLRPAKSVVATTDLAEKVEIPVVVKPKLEKPKPVVIASATPSNGPMTTNAFRAIATGEGGIRDLTQPTGPTLPTPRPVEKTSTEIAAENNQPKERPIIPGNVVPTCGTPEAKEGTPCVDAPKERSKGTGTFWENVGLGMRFLRAKQDTKPMVLEQSHKIKTVVTLNSFELAARMQPDGSLRPDVQPEIQQSPEEMKAEIVVNWPGIGLWALFSVCLAILGAFAIYARREYQKKEPRTTDQEFWIETKGIITGMKCPGKKVATRDSLSVTVEAKYANSTSHCLRVVMGTAKRQAGVELAFTETPSTDGHVTFLLTFAKPSTATAKAS